MKINEQLRRKAAKLKASHLTIWKRVNNRRLREKEAPEITSGQRKENVEQTEGQSETSFNS